jgi:hypothetical protein
MLTQQLFPALKPCEHAATNLGKNWVVNTLLEELFRALLTPSHETKSSTLVLPSCITVSGRLKYQQFRLR